MTNAPTIWGGGRRRHHTRVSRACVLACLNLFGNPRTGGDACLAFPCVPRLLQPFEAFYNLLKGKIKESFIRCTSHSTELTESAESSWGSVHFVHSVKKSLPFFAFYPCLPAFASYPGRNCPFGLSPNSGHSVHSVKKRRFPLHFGRLCQPMSTTPRGA
jgi:hypothetical protein